MPFSNAIVLFKRDRKESIELGRGLYGVKNKAMATRAGTIRKQKISRGRLDAETKWT